MGQAIHDLKAIERSGAGDVRGVVARLREQQAAGRAAGYAPIVHLCESLEDCLTLERLLTGDRGGMVSPHASMVAVLVDACRAIQLHAEAADKTASYLRRRASAGPMASSRPMDSSGRLLPRD